MLFLVRNLDWAQWVIFLVLPGFPYVPVFNCGSSKGCKWLCWSWLSSHILGCELGWLFALSLVLSSSSRLDQACSQGVSGFQERKQRHARLCSGWGSTLPPTTSSPFCWEKCITRPPRLKWWRDRLHLLMAGVANRVDTGKAIIAAILQKKKKKINQ